jgi:hypothetical protein
MSCTPEFAEQIAAPFQFFVEPLKHTQSEFAIALEWPRRARAAIAPVA